MTAFLFGVFVGGVVVWFYGAYVLLWAVRFAWARWAIVAALPASMLFLGAFALLALGRPLGAEFYRWRAAGEAELFGSVVEEPERILLALVDREGPVLVALPFDRALAEALQETKREAAREGGRIRVDLSRLFAAPAERGAERGGGVQSEAEVPPNPFFVYRWQADLPRKE